MTRKIYPGKWIELEEIKERYNEIKTRMGFPAKKRYPCMIGNEDKNTLISRKEIP